MALPLIIRAIITGFGYKLGSELGKFVVDKIKKPKDAAAETEVAADDLPEGLPKDPANPGADEPSASEEPDPAVARRRSSVAAAP